MPKFYVRWEIELEADTAYDAALEVQKVQRDPRSIATVYEVREHGSTFTREIDLGEKRV